MIRFRMTANDSPTVSEMVVREHRSMHRLNSDGRQGSDELSRSSLQGPKWSDPRSCQPLRSVRSRIDQNAVQPPPLHFLEVEDDFPVVADFALC